MTNKIDYAPITYLCNGATSDFPFSWKILDKESVIVRLFDADNTETLLNLDTDYSVDFEDVGGNVHTSTVYNSGYSIKIERNSSDYQEKSFSTSPGFQASEIEKAFDNTSLNLQEMKNNILEFKQGINTEFVEFKDYTNQNINTLYSDFETVQNSVGNISDSIDFCIQKADEVQGIYQDAEILAESMQQYVLFGYTPHFFNVEDWQQEGDVYNLDLEGVSFINGIYRKNDSNDFEKVINVNQTDMETGTILTSIAPFEGYVLKTLPACTSNIFNQEVESDIWSITHNLRGYPCVTCIDTAGTMIIGTVIYTSLNALEIHFEAPQAGKAILK